MSQVVTNAGEALFAQKAQTNEQLDIDTFIFAYVPGQDSQAPIDRSEGLPPTAQRVHSQPVQQVGRINNNTVVYSTVLNSLTGPFEFNWVGLYSSVNNTLVAISYVKSVNKTITELGNAGNTLNRNFAIEYSGISDITGITVAPETWQLDFSARLAGMDALTQNLAMDMNGRDWFIGDGFKVEPTANDDEFRVIAGVGYVHGMRVELEHDYVFSVQSYPQNVYVDAWFNSDASNIWEGKKNITVANNNLNDYSDSFGIKHFIFRLATIENAETAIDRREYSSIFKHINDVDEMLKRLCEINKIDYDENNKNLLIDLMRNNKKHKIIYPEEMQSHLLKPNIYFKGGRYFTDFDIKSLKPIRENILFVDILAGADSNPGTEIAPFKTIEAALKVSGNNEIRLVRTGKYYYSDGPKGYKYTRGVSIISTKGMAILTCECMPRLWIEDEVYPGVWTTSSDNGIDNFQEYYSNGDIRFFIRDKNSSTSYGYQIENESIETIRSGKEGYIVGSTNTILRMPNGLNPNEDDILAVSVSRENVYIHCDDKSDQTIYLENLECVFSGNGAAPIDLTTSSNGSKILLNNCGAHSSHASNGFGIRGNGLCVNYKCTAYDNYKDGLNYHINSAVSGISTFSVLEIECSGQRNGNEQGGLAHNGSTFHSTIKGIRINCDHSYNRNRCVHDVGGTVYTFNIGVIAKGSWSDMPGLQCGFDEDDNVRAWYIGCDTDFLYLGKGSNNKPQISDDTIYSRLVDIDNNFRDYTY